MVIFIYFLMFIKCGGVLIKIIYLVFDYWCWNGLVSQVKKKFIKGGFGIFVVKKYVDFFIKVVDCYGVECVWKNDFVEFCLDKKEVVFCYMEIGEEMVE